MVESTARMQKAIDHLQTYPQLADDYVKYLMYMEEISDEVSDKLHIIDMPCQYYS